MQKKPDIEDLEHELILTVPADRVAKLIELLDVARRCDRVELVEFAIELEIDERTNGCGSWH